MEVLFITPQEIAKTTIMGGNVDIDRYVFSIASVQKTVIEPLLGTELYDVIYDGVDNSNLSGLYLELYTKFIKPITKNEALAQYIEVANMMVSNGGVFQHLPDNAQIPDNTQIQGLADKYHNLADTDVTRFEKWICKNDIPEYKTSQDEVNAQSINRTSGWYL